MNTPTPNRRPAGSPSSTGGQFAPTGRGESSTDLAAPTTRCPADGISPAAVPQAGAFDDYFRAASNAEGFRTRGQWAAVEHTHTCHPDEVADGAENEATSDDLFQVHEFDSESDLQHFVEQGGYIQPPWPVERDSTTDRLEAEPYSSPVDDTVEDRRLEVFRPEPAVPDFMRDNLRAQVVQAVYAYETGPDGNPLEPGSLPAGVADDLVADFDDFIDANNQLLTSLRREHPGYDLRNLAADFHLSRCGHGAGFFDRGLAEVGDELQKRARAYGDIEPLRHPCISSHTVSNRLRRGTMTRRSLPGDPRSGRSGPVGQTVLLTELIRLTTAIARAAEAPATRIRLLQLKIQQLEQASGCPSSKNH